MKSRPKLSHHRPRVLFKRRTMPSSSRPAGVNGRRIVVLDDVYEQFTSSHSPEGVSSLPMVPDLFTSLPLIRDVLETETSRVQDETVEACLPFLTNEDDSFTYNENGVPRLDRQRHIKFLHSSLGQLPGRFVAVDAARPWFLYWCLSGLKLLGEDISPYRSRVIETALSMQNSTGGFGGGNGQLSHLATTYAVVLALALVGGEDAYEAIDRRALWRWLCSLKQPDGGFQVCLGGEEDIRGGYCAAVIISLLNIPLDLTPESPAWREDSPTLFSGLAEYVGRCQTFEGGISAHPDSEAHGAYAFCALGCLSILGDPGEMIPTYLDVPRLIAWLSSRQHAPEAGFSGRTNKLVDGCYSHWVGGCWPLVEACLSSSGRYGSKTRLPPSTTSLFSREGLIRYILCCCQDQSKRGGLRDKPGKASDQYHSCYVLSGLSSAQHKWQLAPSWNGELEKVWTVSPYRDEPQIFDERDRLLPVHPVYVIPQSSQESIRDYFLAKQGFQ
ncbi:hypothetical protein VTK73DRAFT_8158 [Phialemonium thermophilum]|uniref:Protein farnesyltransferase subunit beta n=1 Tax=Phialemonium thermophilum TaxID=223376 RepID=A0ABR3WAP9_9PEZI